MRALKVAEGLQSAWVSNSVRGIQTTNGSTKRLLQHLHFFPPSFFSASFKWLLQGLFSLECHHALESICVMAPLAKRDQSLMPKWCESFFLFFFYPGGEKNVLWHHGRRVSHYFNWPQLNRLGFHSNEVHTLSWNEDWIWGGIFV